MTRLGGLKRFLLFHGYAYYPLGGWSDFGGDFESKDEAQAGLPSPVPDWAHVVDLDADGGPAIVSYFWTSRKTPDGVWEEGGPP